MKIGALSIAAALLATSASATVLNFDDLIGQANMPNGYGGIADWSGWQYYDWDQHPYNPTSPPTRIYNISNGVIDIGADVGFRGAWFNGHGDGDGFLPIYFDLYLDGNLVHTSGSISLDGSGNAQYLDAGYGGMIDRIQVQGSHGFYVMDDFEYIIPTPGAATVLGLAGLAAARRRRS
jgi:hypothetical protein